jgi:hypothetical protein
MRNGAAVCVDDDLSTGQHCIAVCASRDKRAGWVNEDSIVSSAHFSGNHSVNDVSLDFADELTRSIPSWCCFERATLSTETGSPSRY